MSKKKSIGMVDPAVLELIQAENARQASGLEMIPSENHVSGAVLEALGSRLSDKYAEGYPGKRYYGGCQNVDKVENLARDRAQKLFGVDHANVQPYSGSPANQAVYFALLDPGDKVMGMSLYFGGHLTHGHKVNFAGTLYNSVLYQTGKDGFLDYEAIARQAQKEKPKLIWVGATAYPRAFDWSKFYAIAQNCGAWLAADISHIAGLVVAGEHASPVGYADVITTTTHKTLRGPRGAMILCNGKASNPLKAATRAKENLPTLIDRAVFPGLQGGPHNHQTAAIAVALQEAATPEFVHYGKQVVKNAKALASALLGSGLELVTGGTDNHMLLLDLTKHKVSGKEAEVALEKVGITVNKNTVPYDPRTPFDPSGIRLGTPAITTRGMKEPQMQKVAGWIIEAIQNNKSEAKLGSVKKEVEKFCQQFPLPS